MRILIFAICALLCAAPAHAADDLNSIYQPYSADTEKNLTDAHRGVNELGAWLSETVATTLQFSPGTNARKLGEIRPLFTDAGFKAYTDFLSAQGYGAAIQGEKLGLTSIVNSTPMLIGQGSSAGRYAWAYEMQTVLSSGNTNNSVTIRIQVGRNANAANPMGVLIESWQVYQEPPAADPATNGSGKPGTQP